MGVDFLGIFVSAPFTSHETQRSDEAVELDL